MSDRVADEIRAMLGRKRVTGRQLAERLGVSRSWVSYRLTGSQEIGLNDLQRIAEALEVRVAELLPQLQPAYRDDRGEGSAGRTNVPSSIPSQRTRSEQLMAVRVHGDHHVRTDEPRATPARASRAGIRRPRVRAHALGGVSR